jgi:hypothetical protein
MSYEEMYKKFINCEITEEEWRQYCWDTLKVILMENIDVFKRLKDR